jgi:hypothetical protein
VTNSDTPNIASLRPDVIVLALGSLNARIPTKRPSEPQLLPTEIGAGALDFWIGTHNGVVRANGAGAWSSSSAANVSKCTPSFASSNLCELGTSPLLGAKLSVSSPNLFRQGGWGASPTPQINSPVFGAARISQSNIIRRPAP